MTRTTASIVAGIALLPFAVVLTQANCPAAEGAAAMSGYSSGSNRAAVEEQFAVRFCFSQYKSQPDALACLARYIR